MEQFRGKRSATLGVWLRGLLGVALVLTVSQSASAQFSCGAQIEPRVLDQTTLFEGSEVRLGIRMTAGAIQNGTMLEIDQVFHTLDCEIPSVLGTCAATIPDYMIEPPSGTAPAPLGSCTLDSTILCEDDGDCGGSGTCNFGANCPLSWSAAVTNIPGAGNFTQNSVLLTPGAPGIDLAPGMMCGVAFTLQVNPVPNAPTIPEITEVIFQASGLLGMCDNGLTAAAEGTLSVELGVCDVDLQKEVSCDGGATWVESCQAAEGAEFLVRYTTTAQTQNLGLFNCTITDQNPANDCNVAPFDLTEGQVREDSCAKTCQQGVTDDPALDDATISCECREPGSGITRQDTDPALATCISCEIDLQKEVSCDGIDWALIPQTCTGPGCAVECEAGQTIQVRYIATNDCPSRMCSCALSDSNPECPADVADTGCLDPGETRVVHFTATKECVDGVTDLAEPDRGELCCLREDNGEQVCGVDYANFDCVDCGVMIQKQSRCDGVNWVENCSVETGQPIEVRYVVTNTSTTETIDNCSIVESNPELASCVPPTFSIGPGGVSTFECSVPCTTGVTDAAEPDTATVSCDCAIDLPAHTLPVNDDDTANFSCVDAQITLDKTTNGVDGAQAFVGDPIEWRYTVTNPGSVSISNVAIVDDAGTPGAPGDDFPCVGIPSPASGDTNGNALLDPGETWICTVAGVAQRGLYQNVATVTGSPQGGTPPQVSATDPSSYTGYLCDIDINREVSCDCVPGNPGAATFGENCEAEADSGDKLKFMWTVSNVGDLQAQLCEITDDNVGLNDRKAFPIGIGDIDAGGSIAVMSPSTDPPGCWPSSVDFDEMDPGIGDVDCQCVLPDLSSAKPINANDPAQLRVRTECAISVDKQISCDFGYNWIDVGFNDDVTEFCLAADDMQPIELRYVIRNDSMDPVSSCTLTDSNPEIDLSGCPAMPAQLMPDQEYVCQVQETCLDPSDDAEPDTATATCECAGGTSASDTDSGWFDCRDCDADVDRQISCDGGLTWTDEGWRDGASGACAANNGDPISVRYLVRARSVKGLNNCTITDSNAGILNAPIQTGPLAKDFEGIVHTVDFACGAAFDSGGPDTVSIACDCIPTCQETSPFGANFCIPGCPADVSAADSDQSQLTCN